MPRLTIAVSVGKLPGHHWDFALGSRLPSLKLPEAYSILFICSVISNSAASIVPCCFRTSNGNDVFCWCEFEECLTRLASVSTAVFMIDRSFISRWVQVFHCVGRSAYGHTAGLTVCRCCWHVHPSFWPNEIGFGVQCHARSVHILDPTYLSRDAPHCMIVHGCYVAVLAMVSVV